MIDSTEGTGDGVPPARAQRPKVRRVNVQAARDRRRRLVTWGLSITLGVLLVGALIGENGYLATLATRREFARVQADVALLRLENKDLQDRARRLQTDPSAIEEAAREQLNFIRPGETLVILTGGTSTTRPSPTR